MSMTDSDNDQRYGQFPPRRYFGKYAGVVSKNDPPAPDPHRGEVQVKVPGILEETDDGNGHQPIVVLAAPAFLPGFFFVPEVGDPVWIEFVAGDINYPIWTGMWYPANAIPSAVGGSAPTRTQRVIRTKSGHVVQLDDTSGSEQLVIKDTTNGNTITSDAKGITLTSATAVTLSFKPNSGTAWSVTLDTNGFTVTCGESSFIVTSDQITLTRPAVTLTVASTVDVS